MSIIALKRVVNMHNFLLTAFLQDYISFPVTEETDFFIPD